MWNVYILKSESTGRFYKGSTEDLDVRLKSHNAGKVKSTMAFRPWVVHYSESFEDKADALKRERFLKTRSGWRWLKRSNII